MAPPGERRYSRAMLARRFLIIIAVIIALVVAAAIGWRIFAEPIMRVALVPSAPYVAPSAQALGPDYTNAKLWAARPDLPSVAARWTPTGFAAAPKPGVAVFFVPPTAIFDRSRWNAAVNDPDVNARIDLYLRGQASVFNGVAEIWAPRYRQATFGAFLTDKPEAAKAIDLAYGDVRAAFHAFLAAQPDDRPIILAGHSQGSLHLLRLLKDEVTGDPKLKARIIAIYAPGWPISQTADLPALGFPACTTTAQTGCVLSWLSFAEDADFTALRTRFDGAPGLTGASRKGTQILCVNPLTGAETPNAALPAANLGALTPNGDMTGGMLVPGTIGAQCLASGILDIGATPAGFPDYVLPGNNYHVYDYALFWANLRADAEGRVSAWLNANARPDGRPMPVSD